MGRYGCLDTNCCKIHSVMLGACANGAFLFKEWKAKGLCGKKNKSRGIDVLPDILKALALKVIEELILFTIIVFIQ